LDTWRRPVTLFIAIAIGALIVWAIVDVPAALAFACVVLVFVVLAHVRDLTTLQRWLKDPRPETMPNVSSAWEPTFTQLARLIRSQRRSSSELRVTLDRFRLAAAAIPDGVCMLDVNDRIEWCNPTAEVHLGLDAKRDGGIFITNLLRQPEFAVFLGAAPEAPPLRLKVTRDGRELALSLQLVPYGEEQKLLLSRDVTRFEEVETIRRDFVANVSHELRTPITVVAGFLENLADTPKPPPELLERSVHLMRDQTLRMQRLVEDLLTLSRLESEQYPLKEAPVEVRDLARKLGADARGLSHGRHRIRLELDSRNWLNGSEDELRSAFGNLVSNAVRYTPEGGRITIGWGSRGTEAVFWVQDTGIGIEPEHIPRLTERFYRIDRSRSRATGGTGLGLAIVKHVLNRHQAQLEVASEAGKGSTFSVVFPHGRVLAAPPEKLASPRDASTEPGHKPVAQRRIEVR
jgi:two-component system, OmpR family, phosphate regulon sensor histidine kinase PhoR